MKIKKIILNNELFSQFRKNPDKLKIEILEPGDMYIHLSNFPGLNTKCLNNAAFHNLNIEEIDLKNTRIASGGPDGVILQCQYVLPSNFHLENNDIKNLNNKKFK